MHISHPRAIQLMAISLVVLSVFAAGCCCCMSGSGLGGGASWTPTPSPHITNVADANFTSVVLQSEKPTLVDFWAPWCGPCREIDPAVVAIAEEFQDRIEVARLNVDENPETSNNYQVWSIPTLALYADGELIAQQIGAPPGGSVEQGLRNWLEANLPVETP